MKVYMLKDYFENVCPSNSTYIPSVNSPVSTTLSFDIFTSLILLHTTAIYSFIPRS